MRCDTDDLLAKLLYLNLIDCFGGLRQEASPRRGVEIPKLRFWQIAQPSKFKMRVEMENEKEKGERKNKKRGERVWVGKGGWVLRIRVAPHTKNARSI